MLPDFKFHHIGIAVFDIDATARYYVEAGYKKSETIVDPIQKYPDLFFVKGRDAYVGTFSSCG